jgi:plasmid stabilization system protein ParE
VIRLSRKAQAQVASLVRHFEALERPEATRNLRAVLIRASARITLCHGLFFDAPRPYPGLLRLGWRWTKEGPYWIAHSLHRSAPVIQAVFHEAANIPDRL